MGQEEIWDYLKANPNAWVKAENIPFSGNEVSKGVALERMRSSKAVLFEQHTEKKKRADGQLVTYYYYMYKHKPETNPIEELLEEATKLRGARMVSMTDYLLATLVRDVRAMNETMNELKIALKEAKR